MPTSIYAYQKLSTPHTIIDARLPDNAGPDDDLRCTELCTIAGVTYLAVPDELLPLPEQPEGIDLQPVELTPELKERIRAASPHLQLIARRIIDKIRSRYSIDDELFMARMAGGISTGLYEPTESELAEVAEYGAFVEGVRAWGRAERAKLGV